MVIIELDEIFKSFSWLSFPPTPFNLSRPFSDVSVSQCMIRSDLTLYSVAVL